MNIFNFIKCPQGHLENIVIQVLDLARSSKHEAEVEIIKNTGIFISTRYGTLENVELNDSSILSVIVYNKNHKGKATSNDFSESSINSTVNSAINIARYTSVDLYAKLTDKNLLAFHPMDLDLFHPIDLNISLGVMLSSDAEKSALQYDHRIFRTEGGRFNSQLSTKVVGNTHGMLQSYNSSQYSLSCGVVAKDNDNMERDYAYTLSRSFNNLNSSEWVGKECARRTLARLYSKKLKTMSSSVLFSSEVAISLFNHLVDAISGINVYRKSTFLLDSLGKKIFPDWISIKEYPHILQALGSAPFDSEGVKTTNRIIVENGVLNTWLLDNYSAEVLGKKSTGHANGPYNWHVSFNYINFDDLIKQMNKGFVVTELLGQGVNIINGNYSRGASGFWVECGKIQYPVSEVTIAGNLKDMFKNILAIGSDIEKRSYVQCGSVLISSMKIAGK